MTNPPKEKPMKYMLMIYQGSTPLPGTPEWALLSDEQRSAVYAGYQSVNETPGMTPGLQMAPPETARTVQVDGGQTLTTDGPFAETKEALGGYLFFETDDPAAVVELAAKIPAASMGGTVEIRQIVER
jgi:hypothetical protein